MVLLALDQGCRYADRVSACKLQSTKRSFTGWQCKKISEGPQILASVAPEGIDFCLNLDLFRCSLITYDLVLSTDATDGCLPFHTLHCGCGALWIHQHAETALQPAGEQQHIM